MKKHISQRCVLSISKLSVCILITQSKIAQAFKVFRGIFFNYYLKTTPNFQKKKIFSETIQKNPQNLSKHLSRFLRVVAGISTRIPLWISAEVFSRGIYWIFLSYILPKCLQIFSLASSKTIQSSFTSFSFLVFRDNCSTVSL